MHSRPTSALLSFALLLSVLTLVRAATELKFNAGGLATLDYLADPSSLVTGSNKFYRGPSRPGLKVGISHRWGTSEGFAYNFPTGDGAFDVDLIFAEVFPPAQGVGRRVFDVAIEDGVVLKNFDVFKEGGKDKEITKSFKNIKVEDGDLSIAFIQGLIENPMVSAIVLRKSDGGDISLKDAEGNNIEVQDISTGEGTGKPIPGVFDHQSHAVAGGPYVETDFNNDLLAEVSLDGTGSHSHFIGDNGEVGRIVKYEWKADGKVINTKPKFTREFPVGTTKVVLTVTDQNGDAASASVEVKVLPSKAGGAYCYYYNGAAVLPVSLDSQPKPDEGHSTNIIDFDPRDIPYSKKDGGKDGATQWAMRCMTEFSSKKTKQYKFSIRYQGGGATLFVKNGQKVTGGPSENGLKTISATVTVDEGSTPIQVLYYKSKGTSSSIVSLLLNDKVVAPEFLAFKSSNIIPTISSISRSTVPPSGGGQMQVVGTGLVNGARVKIGKATPAITKTAANVLRVGTVPSSADAGGSTVQVTVTNRAGTSNAITLKYDARADEGIVWEQSFFKLKSGFKYPAKQMTAVAIGPDSNYYFGSAGGYVSKVVVDRNLVVQSSCNSNNLGRPEEKRKVLGLAFNYKSKTFRVYVSTSTLYWNQDSPFARKPDGWTNGKVETLVGPGGCDNTCLCYGEAVVTGLPVSNRDHAVNELLFKGGDLLIAVGGFTNAGVNTPGNPLGGFPENPLSAAIVLAKMSKGAGFNGNIKYSNVGEPAKAKVIGGDVSVYASGFRNCFGMALDTNGKVWATDNGGNFGFGEVSTSCTTNARFNTRQLDELNLVEKGKYYGHPNRNRGECVFGAGVKPKALLVSSTTGVCEYTANVFRTQLKGHIITSKYAASGSGVVSASSKQNDQIDLKPMLEFSGVKVITGLYGELVMPRYSKIEIGVLKPKYTKPSGPFVIAVSPRRGIPGATVFVSGENFAPGMTVKFASNAATVVRMSGTTGAFVKVPSGSGVVAVQVTVSGRTSDIIPGGDFIYE